MTAQQVKDYVLCNECEDLFNKNGEAYTLKWMWNGEDFRLFDRLSVAHEVRISDKYTAYSGTAIGVIPISSLISALAFSGAPAFTPGRPLERRVTGWT